MVVLVFVLNASKMVLNVMAFVCYVKYWNTYIFCNNQLVILIFNVEVSHIWRIILTWIYFMEMVINMGPEKLCAGLFS